MAGRILTAADSAQQILAANGRGEEVVSILVTTGPATGARALICKSGAFHGGLGDAALDEEARALARVTFDTREPQLSNGLFAELHTPAEQLIIFGAGHIAVPLADLGVKLGYAVTILDDRDEFADTSRFPAEANVLRLDLAAPLKDLVINSTTYVVLVTRAHKHDFDLVRALLAHDEQARYVGMIGSRRRVRAAFTALLEGGATRDQLAQVRAPVGLDIGAETPAEIAVSIAAELIRVRRSGSSESLTTAERVLDRFFAEPAP